MKVIHDQKDIQDILVTYELSFLKPYCSQMVHMHLRDYTQREIIMQEGEELDGLYFQVEGVTRVSSSVVTGKSLLLRHCRPLSIFGDIEFIRNVPVQSRVDVEMSARFLYLSKSIAQREIMSNPSFMYMLLEQLAYKLQTCTTASRINLLASVEERFAAYLLTIREADDFGKEMYSPHISEIASVIGTTPRHLHRVLQSLQSEGILHKSRQALTILDWDRIQQMSNGLRYS